MEERDRAAFREKGKTKTVFEEGTFVFASVFAYLKCVLAALGPEGVGAADEQQLLGRQRRDDSDVILALVLKREREKKEGKCIYDFLREGGAVGRLRPGANFN